MPSSHAAALPSLEDARLAAERRHILRALALTGGEIIPAAKALGISRTTLWEKMRRLGIASRRELSRFGNPNIAPLSRVRKSEHQPIDSSALPAPCTALPICCVARALPISRSSILAVSGGRNAEMRQARRRWSASIPARGRASRPPARRLRRWCRPRRRPRAGQAIVAYPSNRLANVKDLKVNEPLEVAYPDADAPGVLIKLGTKVDGGVGPDGDIVGFSTICPHKGFPLGYNAGDKTLNCPGHYSRFDCRARRPGDLGPGDPEPAAIRAARRRQGRHLRRGPRRAPLRPPVQRALREGEHGLQASHRSAADHSGECQGAQRHLPLLHRRLRLPRLHLGREQAGRRRAGRQRLRRRPVEAAGGRDRRLVLAVDVQHRQAGRPRRSHRHQARQGLRGELRPRLDPRRAHGRDELQPRSATPSCSASPTRWSGATARCSRPAGTTRSISSRASPRPSSTSRARTASSSPPSTMAAPAAATRTPGAPASSISVR